MSRRMIADKSWLTIEGVKMPIENVSVDTDSKTYMSMIEEIGNYLLAPGKKLDESGKTIVKVAQSLRESHLNNGGLTLNPVSYTHLTLPTTPYV